MQVIDDYQPQTGTARLAVQPALMDAARLGFAPAVFACVLLHLAIAVVPDPVATMREVSRVLRPGGRVSVFDKFLPDGTRPSWARRAAGAAAKLVATDLNRELGPLLEADRRPLRYRHVAVDEVQDFSEQQVFLMAEQANPEYRAVTVVGDLEIGRAHV